MPFTPITPTITTAFAGISVTCPFTVGGVTYQQVINSLGKYVYGTNFIYISASTFPEITQAVYYNHFNASGDSLTTYLPFSPDPYQSQPSLYYSSDDDVVIFDGFSNMTFNIFASSTVYLKYYMTITYIGSELDETSSSAFKMFEEEQSMDFFAGYCDYLIDA